MGYRGYIGFLFLAFFFSLYPSSLNAGPLDSWYARYPLQQGPVLSRMAYGNNTFVAIGQPGPILTSPDGKTWTSRPLNADVVLCGIAYGNNTFVAVGAYKEGHPIILTSPDGVTWTSRPLGQDIRLSGVAYGNEIFVAVGDHGGFHPNERHADILTSADGITWTSRLVEANTGFLDITYGKGLFVAVGGGYTAWQDNGFFPADDHGTVLTSPDGITWRISYSTTAGSKWPRSITYGNNLFVAVGNKGTILSSQDGNSWTIIQLNPERNSFEQVVFGNGIFVAVGSDYYVGGGRVAHSSDGYNWTEVFMADYWGFSAITYSDGLFSIAGNYATNGQPVILTSADGSAWTASPLGQAIHYEFSGAAYHDGTFVIVGSNGAILTSSDGRTWTLRPSGTDVKLSQVAYLNNIFLAVGGKGAILTSPDGIAWTSRSSGTDSDLTGAAYGNGKFVIVGSHGTLLTSPDGAAWTLRSSGADEQLKGVAFGKGLFVAVGGNYAWVGAPWAPRWRNVGAVLTSSDGVNWTGRSLVDQEPFTGVAFGKDTFVAGTDYSVLRSADGISWTEGLTAGGARGVSYTGNAFVAVDVYVPQMLPITEIHVSTDGIEWASWYVQDGFGASGGVALGKGTLVLPGYGSILQSGSFCIAAFDSGLLHVPYLIYAGNPYWADLVYVPGTMDFDITAAGAIVDEAPFDGCTPATLSDNLLLHIPDISYRGTSYWLDLMFTNEGVGFKYTDIGVNY